MLDFICHLCLKDPEETTNYDAVRSQQLNAGWDKIDPVGKEMYSATCSVKYCNSYFGLKATST